MLEGGRPNGTTQTSWIKTGKLHEGQQFIRVFG